MGRKKREFVRMFFASAADQIPEGNGGITVPKNLREYASLERECAIIGVDNRLEIWNAETWSTYLAGEEDGFAKGS